MRAVSGGSDEGDTERGDNKGESTELPPGGGKGRGESVHESGPMPSLLASSSRDPARTQGRASLHTHTERERPRV